MKLKDTGLDLDTEVLDIPTMYAMSEEEYKGHIKDWGVFFIDHHDVLRDGITGRPIATTLEQFDILLKELTNQRYKMQSKKKSAS